MQPPAATADLHAARCTLPSFCLALWPYRSNIVRLQGRGPGDQEAKKAGRGTLEWQAGARHSTQPTSPRSCARPKSIQLQKSTPVLGKHPGAADAVSGQPLASRVHRAGSGRAPGPAHRPRCSAYRYPSCRTFPCPPGLPPPPPPSLLKYHPSHPSRGSFPVFWCELESWKWSSPLERIKVEHRDEEGRYLVGAWNDRVFPPPHPYHLVSTPKIFLAPVCPVCPACLWIYASPSNPLSGCRL